MIQEKLMKELSLTAKEGATIRRSNMKFLVGQFQTASKNKEKTVDDVEATKIIKNLYKSMKELTIPNLMKNIDSNKALILEAQDFLNLCEFILPKEATEDDIKMFLKTVDFSQFKNKMQAIGVVTKHFNGNVDGNLVKSIIVEM